MEDEEEEEDVLEFGHPPLPRKLRVGALILVLLAVLALLAVRAWTGSGTTHRIAVPPATPSAPAVGVPPEPSLATPTTTPWPTAPGACGSEPDLAIVSSTPPKEHTGIRVLLGGDRLRMVDFDSGHTVALADARLRHGEYVALLAGALTTYATTGTCEIPGRSRVLRVGADRRISVIGSLGQTEAVLAGGDRAWVVSYPADADHPYGSVTPLGGGPRVRLPAGFYPYAIVSDTLVGTLQPDPGAPPNWLLLVDATTGRVRTNLGQAAWPLATGSGQVIWSSGCDPTSDKPCTLQPGDVAVLHLDTRRLEIVPGIEIPAKMSPGLAFSADGRWLAIALNAGTRTRLLAWRSGLRHPYETMPIPGQVLGSPTLVMLAPPTDR